MRVTCLYTAILIFMAHIPLYAQDTLKLDLAQCRNMAIENSKVVKIAQENIQKAKGQKIAARSAWLPNISASAIGVYNKSEFNTELYLPTYNYDASSGTLVPNLLTDASGSPVVGSDGSYIFNAYAYLPLDLSIQGGALTRVSAEQPLYAGGKIVAANKMAHIGEHMADNNKQLKQSDIIYETDQAYYQYLSVKEKVVLAKKYQKLLEELVRVVEDAYETGMKSRNEVLKVQVKYNDALLQEQKAENGLKLARMSLCRSLGLPFNTAVKIGDSINSVSLNEGYMDSIAAENRVEYQLLKDKAEVARQNIKMIRSDYMPTAGVAVNYNYYVIGLEDMDNYTHDGLSVMGSIKIPITNFGERRGKVKSAKAEYTISQLELQNAQEFLQLEIEQARLNYMDAYTRVEMSQKALEQANENMRICDDNYSLGMETIVNLLEAKAEWQKAYSNKIDALTDLKVKESNFLRVSGQLAFSPGAPPE